MSPAAQQCREGWLHPENRPFIIHLVAIEPSANSISRNGAGAPAMRRNRAVISADCGGDGAVSVVMGFLAGSSWLVNRLDVQLSIRETDALVIRGVRAESAARLIRRSA